MTVGSGAARGSIQRSNTVGVLRGGSGGAVEPRRTTAFEYPGTNHGRLAGGQLDRYSGPSGIGVSYRGLTYDSRPGDPHSDQLALSAEAVSLDFHSTSHFSEDSSRFGGAIGVSLASATLQTRIGNDQDHLNVGLGVSAGTNLGFEISRQRNPDGSQTFGVDLGVSLGGRLDISGQLTAGALTPEDHAERERIFAERFPEGLGGP